MGCGSSKNKVIDEIYIKKTIDIKKEDLIHINNNVAKDQNHLLNNENNPAIINNNIQPEDKVDNNKIIISDSNTHDHNNIIIENNKNSNIDHANIEYLISSWNNKNKINESVDKIFIDDYLNDQLKKVINKKFDENIKNKVMSKLFKEDKTTIVFNDLVQALTSFTMENLNELEKEPKSNDQKELQNALSIFTSNNFEDISHKVINTQNQQNLQKLYPKQQDHYNNKDDTTYLLEDKTKPEQNWNKLSEITDNYIFLSEINFNCIAQGEIGNCYFNSAMSALAEFDYLISNIFQNKKTPHILKLYISGSEQYIKLNDLVPCKKDTKTNKSIAFSRHKGNDGWPSILEKAWAQCNNGYYNTVSGSAYEAINFLTGQPSNVQYIKERENSKLLTFEILQDSDQNKDLMCASVPETKMGLIGNHSYTVLEVQKINDLKLIKMRNPWGHGEWEGDWSDNSKIWTDEIKNLVGQVNEDDGAFFISFEDFSKYIDSVSICNNLLNSGLIQKCFNMKKNKICIKIKLNSDNTDLCITLNQGSKRLLRNLIENQDNEWMKLCVADENFHIINSETGADDHINLLLKNLPNQIQQIFGEIHENQKIDELPLFIGIWSKNSEFQDPIIIDDLQQDILIKVLSNRALEDETENIEGVLKQESMNICGYHQAIMSYKNETTNKTYYEDLKMKLKGLILIQPKEDYNKSEIKVIVTPGEQINQLLKWTTNKIHLNSSYNHYLIENLSDEEIIQKTTNEGDFNEYGLVKSYSLQLNKNFYFYYINKGEGTFKGTFSQELKNLQIDDSENNENEYKIELKSNEWVLKKLICNNKYEGSSYSSSVSYSTSN